MSAHAKNTVVAWEVCHRKDGHKLIAGYGQTSGTLPIRKRFSVGGIMDKINSTYPDWLWIHVFISGPDIPEAKAAFEALGVHQSKELPKEGNMSPTRFSRGVTFDTSW